MNLTDLINQNISKKWGVAVFGIASLVYTEAPTWQIMTVAVSAVIVQGILDLLKKE